jgi:hypothetical protein
MFMFISRYEFVIIELVFFESSFVIEVEVRNECLMVDHAKCTMQSALNVIRNVKFLSNQTKVDLYTAENVTVINVLQEVDISFPC